jgi:hypothetical protein
LVAVRVPYNSDELVFKDVGHGYLCGLCDLSVPGESNSPSRVESTNPLALHASTMACRASYNVAKLYELAPMDSKACP